MTKPAASAIRLFMRVSLLIFLVFAINTAIACFASEDDNRPVGNGSSFDRNMGGPYDRNIIPRVSGCDGILNTKENTSIFFLGMPQWQASIYSRILKSIVKGETPDLSDFPAEGVYDAMASITNWSIRSRFIAGVRGQSLFKAQLSVITWDDLSSRRLPIIKGGQYFSLKLPGSRELVVVFTLGKPSVVVFDPSDRNAFPDVTDHNGKSMMDFWL